MSQAFREELRGSVTPETGSETERVVAWTPEEFPFLDLILSPIPQVLR